MEPLGRLDQRGVAPGVVGRIADVKNIAWPFNSLGHLWCAVAKEEPNASDDGFERVVVQQPFFTLIERVFEMEEERAAEVDKLA